MTRIGAVPGPARRAAFGRHEAEAGADVYAAASPANSSFWTSRPNGSTRFRARDFWAILYQLLQDGITIFMTTAYLDEAERCNRVGLMHKGKLIPLRHAGGDEAGDRTASLEGGVHQEHLAKWRRPA